MLIHDSDVDYWHLHVVNQQIYVDCENKLCWLITFACWLWTNNVDSQHFDVNWQHGNVDSQHFEVNS